MRRFSPFQLIPVFFASVLLTSLFAVHWAQAQDSELDPDYFRWTSDWPSEPSEHATLRDPAHLEGRLRAEALRRLESAPASASTVAWLLKAQLHAEALTALRRIVDDRPERIAEALEHVHQDSEFQQTLGDTVREKPRQLRSQLEGLLRDLRVRMASLPRDRQAELSWELHALEQWLAREPAHPESERREQENESFIREFIKEYAGTAAAAKAEVSLILATSDRTGVLALGNPREDRHDASLAEYAAAHPGTEAAAMALHARAFRLANRYAHNGREKVDRLIEVLRIVGELESGKFPHSRSTAGAAKLVFEVSFDDNKLSQSDAERALAALLPFLRSHPALTTDPATGESSLYMLESTLAEIGAQTPGGERTTARVLDELRRALPDPAIVHFAKARRLLSPDGRQSWIIDHATVTRELETAAKIGGGRWSRQAWITLAEHEFETGKFGLARARYEAFQRRFPGSDFAWMAAIRAGEIDFERRQYETAARTWLDAARRYGADVPVARAIGSFYAARAFEAAGAFERALDAYRAAAAAWTADLTWHEYGPSQMAIDGARARPPKNPARTSRASIARRVQELTASLPAPGGRELECGRWLLEQDRAADAVATLTPVIKMHAGSATAAEARTVWLRARLEAAIELAEVDLSLRHIPQRNVKAALAALDALWAEPFEPAVGIAGLAAATVRYLEATSPAAAMDVDDANARMKSVLNRWVAEGTRPGPAPAPGTLEEDALAVRDVLFQPLGGGVLGDEWNAFTFPKQLPAFIVAPAALGVRVADGDPVRVDVSRRSGGVSNMIFISRDDVAFLIRLVERLGGPEVIARGAISELPHQPIGEYPSIVTWWDTFFPARPGTWGGFEMLTCPAFSDIEFLDAARTRALVPITIGHAGATAVLEKIDGVWKVTRLVDHWETHNAVI
jgi:hypothetical protein